MLLAAAIAYYTIISLVPMIVVTAGFMSILSLGETVTQEFISQVRDAAGDTVAAAVRYMINNAYRGKGSVLTTVLGGGVLLFASTSLFAKLKDSMNLVWGVERRPAAGGIIGFLAKRLFALAAVFCFGFLLLLATLVDAGMVAAFDVLFSSLPLFKRAMLAAGRHLFSLGSGAVIFTLLFMIFPDARIRWSDVWVGGMVTSALFLAGKLVVGLYLAHTNLSTTYGSAASVMVIVIWVFVVSILFFFGAEIAAAYTRLRRSS